ncbi:unnamed protein product [Coregonus sp. 'balchen']|nr:unnamed protein product [Coregonus sp. 'balchen']
MVIHHLLLKESAMSPFPTSKKNIFPIRITDLQVTPSYLLNLIGSNSSESNLLGNKNVLQIQGEPLLAFHICRCLVFHRCLDAGSIHVAPQSSPGVLPTDRDRSHSGHRSHSGPQAQRVSAQYSATYWLPQHQLYQDQRAAQWRPESYRVANQAGVPWSYRPHLTGGSMDARMYPIFSTAPQQAPTGLLSQARAGPFQVNSSSPLLQFQSYSLRAAIVSQGRLTQITGPSLPLHGSSTELEAEPSQQAGAECSGTTGDVVQPSPAQQGSGRSQCPSTLDHSLDQEDLEACMQRLLEAQGSEGTFSAH